MISTMAGHDERRSNPRVGFKVPAHITVGQVAAINRGYVLNLSETGVFIMLDHDVALGPTIQLQFNVAPASLCQASGSVAHSMEMGIYQGVGCEITASNDAYKHFLRNLAAASPTEILFFIEDMKRINVHIA